MRPYTVKNYLWLAIIIMVVLVSVLSGCSSAPKVQAKKPQYRYTDQTVRVQDGERVSSTTELTCTDDPIKQVVGVKAGAATQCDYHPIKDRNGNVIDQELTCMVIRNGQMSGWVYGVNR